MSNIHKPAPSPPQRFCAHCGTAFVPSRHRPAYYCSETCAEAEQRAATTYDRLEQTHSSAPTEAFDIETCPLAKWFHDRYGDCDYQY